MRLAFARRAFLPILFVTATVGTAAAQSREEIREQNEQLYQQYQQGGGPTAVAPPYGGAGSDVTASSPADAAGGSGGGVNLMAQLLDRVSRLEDENRQLSGRVDELERELQTSTAQVNKQIGDLTFAMQQHGNGIAAAPPPQVAAPPPPPPRAARDARPASRPQTPPAGARGAGLVYQQARAYAAAGNHQQAALAYYDAYNRQPHGPLAADALLHVSASMIALGQNGAACEALGKLHSEFPHAGGNVAHGAVALRARAHC